MRNDLDLQLLLMAVARPNSPARVRQWIKQRCSEEDSAFFVIAVAGSDDAVGFIQLTGVNSLHGIGKLGVALASRSHGQGFGSEAIQLLESYAIRTLRLRKFFFEVLATNDAAISFYRRLGYNEVGRLHQQYFLSGEYQDVVVMEKIFASKN